MSEPDGSPAIEPGSSASAGLGWLVGAAGLAAVVLFVVRRNEERAFVELLSHVEPQWIGWAALLQAATYLAQAKVWLVPIHAAGYRVSVSTAYRLSIAKLFVDQALPSAGVSGTVVMAKALRDRHVPDAVVMASVVVSTASFYAAYALSVVAALAVAVGQGHSTLPLAIGAGLFIATSLGVVAAVLGFSRRPDAPGYARVRRLVVLRRLLDAIARADPRLAHDPRLLVRATAFQLAIVLLDAGTLWLLLHAVGVAPSPAGVFGSFVISSMARTVSIVPGGLGVFEAAVVVSLTLIGVPTLAALSATLLFRGFSFWLPMIPGLLLSRRLGKRPI